MRRLGLFLALTGLAFIASTTLVPLPRQVAAAQATPLWCLVCGDYGGVDVVLNILLFIPFAVGLRLLGVPPAAVVAAGAVLSLTVESLQLAVITGRDASLSDLVTNTLGSLMGAVVGSHLATLLKPTRKQAAHLALSIGAIWLGLQAGSAFLLRPWVPSEPLSGHWGRAVAGRTSFDGRVTSAFLSGSPVGDRSNPVDSQLIALLGQGRVRLELGLVSGPNAPDWSPVFELRGRHGPVLALQADGTDLAFQPPSRSYSLRLRRPALRLPGALPSRPGATLQISAGERQDTLWAAWTRADASNHASQALSPSFGWSLVIPFDYAYGPEVHLLTAFWIAGLLAPLGYWASRSQANRARLALMAGVLVLAGLWLTPRLAGFPAVHWSEWLAAGVGLGVGWVSPRAAAYFGGRCDSPFIKESC